MIAGLRKLLKRILEKGHVVGLLVDLRAGGEEGLVDAQKAPVGEAVVGIGGFRERTGEVQIDPGEAPLGDELLQIFRTHCQKADVGDPLGEGALAALYDGVFVLFHGDNIDMGIPLG